MSNETKAIRIYYIVTVVCFIIGLLIPTIIYRGHYLRTQTTTQEYEDTIREYDERYTALQTRHSELERTNEALRATVDRSREFVARADDIIITLDERVRGTEDDIQRAIEALSAAERLVQLISDHFK